MTSIASIDTGPWSEATIGVPERHGRRLAPGVAALVAVLLASACGDDRAGPPVEWRLEDGRSLGELAKREASAVLVMDPDDCFTCYSVLGPWLKVRSRHDGRMFFLFTRQPDDRERRTILAAGIRADGVIEEGGPPPQNTPVEIAFRRGRTVYHAIRVSGSSPLLNGMERGSLEEFVAAPPVATADPQPAHRIPNAKGDDDG